MGDRPARLGNYELCARIARGGMAEIYLARVADQREPGDLVVLKRILPHLAEEKPFVEMFLEEGRLAAMVQHPNVVRIFEVGQDGDDYFMVMEYVDGPSAGALSRRARERAAPIPTPIAAGIVIQACDGLHAAHEIASSEADESLGIVHRDVSPHNLMISREGVVKLVDFGVAKAKDTSIRTNTGGIKGKFPYMSPEQAEGLELDRRSDIFSLGTAFYELVTAQRLFLRSTELLTLRAICEEPIKPPRELAPSLSPAVNAVIMHALERDRDARFATTLEIKEALLEALGDEAESATPEALGHFLRGELGPILDRRAAALERIARKPAGAMPALVRGFDDNETNDETKRKATSEFEAKDIAEADLAVAALSGHVTADTTVNEVGHLRFRKSERGKASRWAWWLAIFAIVLGIAGGLGYRYYTEQSAPTLRFGLAPVQPAPTVKRAIAPLARYIGRATGHRIELVVAKTYDDLRERLLRNDVDFAALSPLQVVRARRAKKGLRALAASAFDGTPSYQAYLLVRADSGIEHLEALKGKRICYVESGSASGYLMPRHFLRKKGIDPDTFFSGHHFSRTHTGVLRDLLAGRCSVGATYSEYRSARKAGVPTSAVKILTIAGNLPNDCICAAPNLPPALSTKLQEALLRFNPQRDIGREKVAEIYPITSFVRPRIGDFDHLDAAERRERAAKANQ